MYLRPFIFQNVDVTTSFSIPSSGRTKGLNCMVHSSCPPNVPASLTCGLHTRTSTLYIFKNTIKYAGTIARHGFWTLQLSPSVISQIWYFQFGPSKKDGASRSKGNATAYYCLSPSFKHSLSKLHTFRNFSRFRRFDLFFDSFFRTVQKA
jgi:hypothetical protein